MTETWPKGLAEGLRCLATPVEPELWCCASAADYKRPSFFFAWSPADASARCARSVIDRESRLVRSGLAGRNRTAGRVSAFDVDTVLAGAKRNGRSTASAGDFDDIDDSMLRVSCTKLFDRSRRESDPDRYVNPFLTPFIALSIRRIFRARGVELGDFATAMNPRTGRVAHAVIGDDRDLPVAEPSPALADRLDLAQTDRAIYLIHPGTGQGQGTIPADEDILRQGERLFRTPAWSVILAEFAERLDGRE